MKLLVTGGSGFIGSNLALELERLGHNVIVVDNFSTGNRQNLVGFKGELIAESILTFDLNKISDPSRHGTGRDVVAIFHNAAITDTTLKDTEQMIKVNVDGFKRLLDFAVTHNIKFIYASSAGVYGNAPSPLSETMAGEPINLYGQSKWQSDCIAFDYMEQFKAHIIGLRYFNVFGQREQYKGKMASMIWQLAQQILQGKRPRIFKWGDQRRDQVYVKDVVRANILALDAKRNAIVNVGSGCAITFNHIIEVLNDVLGTKFAPDYFDNPYEGLYQNYTQADLTQAKEVLDYTPVWNFDNAVRDYFNNR
ncbi:MAG: ADP-glyceromanno-heptose 6-epimerase [Candidatus Stahlbacteria bacterium]|nr:ADP-glyceromanno-heptose 6-epimerase [Candidatus Stahlbacteria bacterium]